MQGNKAQLGNLLFRLDVIKFGEFRMKLHEDHPDAPLSPIYLDLRTAEHPTKPGPLTAGTMEAIGQLMEDEVRGVVDFDHYVGIPAAGEPFADELEKALVNVPTRPTRLRLRKEQLENGKRRITEDVEGDFAPGETVLVIDDLITQADSKLEAIAALEAKGLVVRHVLVLVDRMQGGREQLEERGYKLLAVFTLEGLLCLYVDEWLIDSDKADEVRKYLRANRI
jgi:uridine monophosphate synthetase